MCTNRELLQGIKNLGAVGGLERPGGSEMHEKEVNRPTSATVLSRAMTLTSYIDHESTSIIHVSGSGRNSLIMQFALHI